MTRPHHGKLRFMGSETTTRVFLIALTIILLSFGMVMIMRSIRESFVVSGFDPSAVPFNIVTAQEYQEPALPSLDFSNCSKDCCTPMKMSSMSCLKGCVCQSDKNSAILTTRGGNRTYDNEGL
jgi:hypothetical protein